MIALYIFPHAHNGDVILSRPFVRQAAAQLPNTVFLCTREMHYLWSDLKIQWMPMENGPPHGSATVHLYCAELHHDLLMQYGVTYRGFLEVYNARARTIHLPILPVMEEPAFADLPQVDLPFEPESNSVLVENGQARSGQQIHDVNEWLNRLSDSFPFMTFYCNAKPPEAPNLVDCSNLNLVQLSTLSRRCKAILGKLSGVTACTSAKENFGKLKIIAGYPHAFPIGDQSNMVFVHSAEEAVNKLASV